MIDEPTLFDVPRRDVPDMPDSFYGAYKGECGYTKSKPREWTDDEIGWIQDLVRSGYSIEEIAESIGRTPTSISIKLKRIGKSNEGYNEAHREEKYEANQSFLKQIRPNTILDLYCGSESWWLKNADNCAVISNDANPDISATFHLKAEKLVAKLYSDGYSFDLIDLDPFGSAYDCFDLAIRMAGKGLIITFGEMGHKRWKRLDFVRRYYGIDDIKDFTTARLIEEVQKIGIRHKKQVSPIIIKEWPRISRVYFGISKIKIIEQWE